MIFYLNDIGNYIILHLYSISKHSEFKSPAEAECVLFETKENTTKQNFKQTQFVVSLGFKPRTLGIAFECVNLSAT